MVLDNPVLRFINKMADLLLLNMVFLISCIPIITIGAAITAMYHVNLRSIRYGDGYVFREYLQSFKQNFWQSTLVWLAAAFTLVLFVIDIYFWTQMAGGTISVVMTVVSACFGFFGLITVVWVFPVIAKLENSLWANVKNAAAMAVGHFFPHTAVCLAILGAAGYAAYTSIAADMIMLLTGFSVVSYALSFFFYKVFANYMQEEPVGEEDPLYGKALKQIK